MAFTIRELLDMSPEERRSALNIGTQASEETSEETPDPDELEGLPTRDINGQTFAFLCGPPVRSQDT